MIDFLREWIMSITGASLLCAGALCITPAGRVRKVVQMLCGVVMILALIRPVLGFDISAYSASLAGYRERMYQIENNIEETNNRLSRSIIEEECSAYILDKAHVIGLDITAAVSAKWGDEGFFIPNEVYIQGAQDSQDAQGAQGAQGAQIAQADRRELESVIESDLGIPAQMVHWSMSTDTIGDTDGDADGDTEENEYSEFVEYENDFESE